MQNIFSILSRATILALSTIAIANATVVIYETTGAFNCNGLVGCTAVGNVATVGGLTLTYQVQTPTMVNANPLVSANFGDIVVSGGSSTAVTTLSNLLLNITINQSSPYGQSNGVFSGIITGALGITSGASDGFATICFVTPNACASQKEAITYSNGTPSVIYTLQTPANPSQGPPANGYTIRATSSNATDATSFQGSITVTPEPSSYMMLASGLMGLGALARRRKA